MTEVARCTDKSTELRALMLSTSLASASGGIKTVTPRNALVHVPQCALGTAGMQVLTWLQESLLSHVWHWRQATWCCMAPTCGGGAHYLVVLHMLQCLGALLRHNLCKPSPVVLC